VLIVIVDYCPELQTHVELGKKWKSLFFRLFCAFCITW